MPSPYPGGSRAPTGSRAARIFEDWCATFLDEAAAGVHGDSWRRHAERYLTLRDAGRVPPGTWARACRTVIERESGDRIRQLLAERSRTPRTPMGYNQGR